MQQRSSENLNPSCQSIFRIILETLYNSPRSSALMLYIRTTKNLKIINHDNNNDEAGFSFECWHSIHANIELKSLIPVIVVNYDDYLKERLSPDKHPPIMNVVRCDEYDPLSNKIVNSKCTVCKCDFRNKNTASPTSICKTLHCDRCMFTSLAREE